MKEVDPKDTDRAMSYELFIKAPMPMVTIFRTIDVTNILNVSEKGYKFNMLLCYCIGCAGSRIHEFRLLPVGMKLMEYEEIGVSVVVSNKKGSISFCDLPFCSDLDVFNQNYLSLTKEVETTCENHEIKDRMMIGTSTLPQYDFDGVINMYNGIFNNPFLMWGKYKQEEARYVIKFSFQFHHVQMDGRQACQFLDDLQRIINGL